MTNLWCLGGGLAIALCAATSYAQTSASDRAAAQGLFDEGKQLLKNGQAAQACPKLEESLRLDKAIGTSYQLAKCYEALGRTASAWNLYLEVAAASRAAGQADREQIARREAARLEPGLSRLAISVPDTARVNELKIERNGGDVAQGQWGVKLPVDPGQYTIIASAPGKKSWKTLVDVRGAAVETVTIPALEDAPVEPGLATGSATAGPTPTSDQGSTRPTKKLTTLQWTGLATGAVGVVSLGVSGVLALKAKNKDDESGCVDGGCPDSDSLEANSDARSLGNIATVTVIAGGVLTAAGATLFLVAPRPEGRRETTMALTPTLGTNGAGLGLSGRF